MSVNGQGLRHYNLGCLVLKRKLQDNNRVVSNRPSKNTIEANGF